MADIERGPRWRLGCFVIVALIILLSIAFWYLVNRFPVDRNFSVPAYRTT